MIYVVFDVVENGGFAHVYVGQWGVCIDQC